ncbi:MAG: hypothetical protein Q8M29_18520 [Bacteroidota bacterium]|nr:hypothetical protein [Bacteroidota bacterium]
MKSFICLNYLVIAVLAVFLVSCNNSESGSAAAIDGISTSSQNEVQKLSLKPVEYIKWVEDPENGFLLEKNINEFSYVALYKPGNYSTLVEMAVLEKINEEKFKEVQKTYEGMDYFTFKIACSETKDELLRYKSSSSGEYFNRLEYFSFKAQNDFNLLNGTDTVKCELFHFERSFGLAPVLTFVIGFSKPEKQLGPMTLIYEDRIFKNGTIKLLFEEEVLNNEPELVLN